MTEKLTGFGVVLVTTASETEAEYLAIALLNERLAACVSIYPIRSIYRWQGQIENALPIVAGSQTYLDWLASHTGRVSE